MKRAAVMILISALLLGVLPVTGFAAEMDGKSALLMELSTGTVIQEKNSHEKLAPASVTKVMTMLLIMEAIDAGKIHWDDPVTASEAAAAKGGSQIYLKVGEVMTVSDMLKSIAVSSANDCACAMAEHLAGSESAFVERMNQRAQELEMQDTHFVNCTGLDDGPDAQSHRTSAHDIAIMSRELLQKHPDIKKFTTIWMDTVRDGAFGLSNTNRLVRFYQGATGLKTGFTRGAGFCLSASAQRDGMELIAVVMGAESSKGRFAACKSMLDYGFANYALATPELPENPSVPVILGQEKTVNVQLGQTEGLLIDKAQRGSITTALQLEESVAAPVAQGQQLGTLTMQAGDQVLAEIPLVSQQAVEKLTWGEIFVSILGRTAMAKQSTDA